MEEIFVVCRCLDEKERGHWMGKMTTRPPGLIEGVANKRTLFHGRSFWTRLGSWYSKQEKQNRNKLTVTNFEDQQIMTTGAAAAHCQCPYCLQILNIICHPGSKLLGIVWLKDIGRKGSRCFIFVAIQGGHLNFQDTWMIIVRYAYDPWIRNHLFLILIRSLNCINQDHKLTPLCLLLELKWFNQ